MEVAILYELGLSLDALQGASDVDDDFLSPIKAMEVEETFLHVSMSKSNL
jgi:hypothetical protein